MRKLKILLIALLGLFFTACSGGGTAILEKTVQISTQNGQFTDLSDTPNTYTGYENYTVKVNANGTGLYFQNVSGGGGGATPAGSQGDIQFNDGGALGADNTINFDTTTGKTVLGGKSNVNQLLLRANSGQSVPIFNITSKDNQTLFSVEEYINEAMKIKGAYIFGGYEGSGQDLGYIRLSGNPLEIKNLRGGNNIAIGTASRDRWWNFGNNGGAGFGAYSYAPGDVLALTGNGLTSKSVLFVNRNLSSTGTDSPVALIANYNTGDDQNTLELYNYGSGDALYIQDKGAGDLFVVQDSTGTDKVKIDSNGWLWSYDRIFGYADGADKFQFGKGAALSSGYNFAIKPDGGSQTALYVSGTRYGGATKIADFADTPNGALRFSFYKNGSLTMQSFSGTYTGGSAYVCVDDTGRLFTSESACP